MALVQPAASGLVLDRARCAKRERALKLLHLAPEFKRQADTEPVAGSVRRGFRQRHAPTVLPLDASEVASLGSRRGRILPVGRRRQESDDIAF